MNKSLRQPEPTAFKPHAEGFEYFFSFSGDELYKQLIADKNFEFVVEIKKRTGYDYSITALEGGTRTLVYPKVAKQNLPAYCFVCDGKIAEVLTMRY